MQVSASTFARKVGVVGRSGKRDGLGGTSEHIRNCVSEALELVRAKLDLIVDDIIVCRTNCALETVVRLKEEIEICVDGPSSNAHSLSTLIHTVNGCGAPIHNGPWPGVSILIRELRFSGEEACMVSLPADHDRQLRSIRLFRIPKGLEGFDNLR
jgi:hypothetical protein